MEKWKLPLVHSQYTRTHTHMLNWQGHGRAAQKRLSKQCPRQSGTAHAHRQTQSLSDAGISRPPGKCERLLIWWEPPWSRHWNHNRRFRSCLRLFHAETQKRQHILLKMFTSSQARTPEMRDGSARRTTLTFSRIRISKTSLSTSNSHSIYLLTKVCLLLGRVHITLHTEFPIW